MFVTFRFLRSSPATIVQEAEVNDDHFSRPHSSRLCEAQLDLLTGFWTLPTFASAVRSPVKRRERNEFRQLGV